MLNAAFISISNFAFVFALARFKRRILHASNQILILVDSN